MIQGISCNTKLLEQSIAYSGMPIYYKLSHEIKSVKCITKFKEILIGFFYLKRVFILWNHLWLLIL